MKINITYSFDSVKKRIEANSNLSIKSSDKELFEKIYKELVLPEFLKKVNFSDVYLGNMEFRAFLLEFNYFFCGEFEIKANSYELFHPMSINLDWILDNLDKINERFDNPFEKIELQYNEKDLSELNFILKIEELSYIVYMSNYSIQASKALDEITSKENILKILRTLHDSKKNLLKSRYKDGLINNSSKSARLRKQSVFLEKMDKRDLNYLLLQDVDKFYKYIDKRLDFLSNLETKTIYAENEIEDLTYLKENQCKVLEFMSLEVG